MVPLLILFIVILIGCIIRYATRPKVVYHIHEFKIPEIKPQEQTYWEGPVPSKAQESKNKAEIFKHIEKFPNGILAERNPEYVQEYLDSIDLDLPEGITPSK